MNPLPPHPVQADPHRRGRLIAFEGGEASGKSTHAALLAQRIGAALTREPGSTLLGERVRHLVLHPEFTGRIDPRAEALLMAAARAQHAAEVLHPTLAAGCHVVTDRYIGSSLAYQGVGRGLGIEAVWDLSRFATIGLEPDLVIFMDLPAEVAEARLRTTRQELDRLENEDAEYHERVIDGFRQLAADHPDRWVVVNADGPQAEVAARVESVVHERLGLRE